MTYHRHQARAQAAMQTGKHDRQDRREERRTRPLVTSDLREQTRQIALNDPEKFVRCLRLAGVLSLMQLPWWTEFKQSYPYEAACITLSARDAGILDR